MAQDPCNQRGSMRSSNNATSKEACSFSSSGVVCRKQSVGGDSTGARTTICLHTQPFAPRTEQCATRSCVNSLRSTSDGRKRHSSTSLPVSPDRREPMKPPAYYKKKEQTYLKHFFLERYLETVAFHIGYTHREFVYVDCFSGPWRSADEDLADTSIRISLDKLNYVHRGLAQQRRDATIRAIFIEKDPAAFRALQAALQQHSHAINTTALPGAFEDNIPEILRRIGNTFAFFFIDPKGWTGFAMDNIRPVLRHQPGEVMVNFMYDFINRFVNYPEPANEQSLDRFFRTTDHRHIRDATDRETASVTKYMEQVRSTGACTYVTSTRILKPLHDRAYFHLVYATRSPKGVIKFRDVEKQAVKEQDAVRTIAQREHRAELTRQTDIAIDAT